MKRITLIVNNYENLSNEQIIENFPAPIMLEKESSGSLSGWVELDIQSIIVEEE